MTTDIEIAAPALPPRLEAVSQISASPWQARAPRRWLAALGAAWREGLEAYALASRFGRRPFDPFS